MASGATKQTAILEAKHRLGKLQWLISGIVATALAAVQGFYFAIVNVPALSCILGWMFAMAVAMSVLYLGFREVYRIQDKLTSDITERKRAEEEMRVKDCAVAPSINASALADLEGNLTYVNTSFLRLWRYDDAKEVLGKPAVEFWHMEEKAAEVVIALFEKGGWVGELVAKRKDGSKFHAELSASMVTGEDGKPICMMASFIDITERKEAEEALRESEAKHRDLVENINDVVYAVDKDGTATYVSPVVQSLIGYGPSEIMGRSFAEFMCQEDLPGAMENFLRVLSGDTTADEYRLRTKSGEMRWVRSSNRPIFDGNGVVGARGVLTDITQRKEVEEARRDSEERFRGIAERSFDAIVSLDLEGRVTYASPAVERMFGYRPEEMIQKRFHSFVPDSEIPKALEMIAGMKSVQNLQMEFVRKDGALCTVEANASPILRDGKVVGYQAAYRDITERKEAEEALRGSEERYRTILEEMGDGYFEGTLAGKYTFVNDSMCRITGYSKEEMLGMDYRILTHQDDVGRVYKVYQEMYRTGRPLERFFVELIRKDGRRRFCEVSASLLRNRAGEVIGFRGVHRDVTERKEAEEALRRSEEKYRTILEDMEDSYFEVDLAGNLTFANDSTCRSLGYPREEMVGMRYRDFTSEEDSAAVYQAFNQVYRTGQPVRDISWTVVRKDGTRGIAEASVFPLRDDEGEIIGFRGIGRDITERRAVQQQLLMSSKLASIGELASGVAHELNNPLTGIMGYAQLLTAKQNVPQDVKVDLDRIYGESQRAAKIVQNLLSFARRRKPEKSYFDVNELVQRVLELRDYELRTSNIGVYVDLAADLPWTMADYHQIQQVLLNIIINSEQAVGEVKRRGKIRVTTGMKEGCIRISVADNGPGIPAEQVGKVFDPFFTTKEVGSGTGLGLRVCHGIITAHGGNIYLESQKGRGTTFTVELPLVRETEAVIEEIRPAPKVTPPRRDEGTARILIVDDEPAICDILVRALSEHGYQTDSASSARTALTKIARNGYELCIIDLKMPVTSGKELYETMKCRFLGPAERVVFMTGDTIEPATERFLVSTGRPHLHKPFGPDEVIKVVEKALGGGP